jgi:two-component system, OmpR family, response regulator
MENAARVLIVEDHETTRDTLALLFENQGFVVQAAGSVREASELFDRDPPTIALVDIGLPDGSGLDLVEAFVGRYPDLPVVVLTASDEKGLAKEATRRGAFSFIQKPYGFADVLAAVHRALKPA